MVPWQGHKANLPTAGFLLLSWGYIRRRKLDKYYRVQREEAVIWYTQEIWNTRAEVKVQSRPASNFAEADLITEGIHKLSMKEEKKDQFQAVQFFLSLILYSHLHISPEGTSASARCSITSSLCSYSYHWCRNLCCKGILLTREPKLPRQKGTAQHACLKLCYSSAWPHADPGFNNNPRDPT